jgi:hypothetical protein
VRQTLTAKLNALLERQERTTEIASVSPVKDSDGLRPHELTALAFLFASSDALDDPVAANWLKSEMRKAGYTDVATRLAVGRLAKIGYVTTNWRNDGSEAWIVYGITEAGESWLIENQSKLELKTSKPAVWQTASFDNFSQATQITDDDIPF